MAVDNKEQNNEQNEEEKYNFIEEKVNSRRKHKIKKFLVAVALTIVLAIIFAITAGIVLCAAREPLFDIFGINKSIIEFDSDEDPDNNDNQPIETETSETEATEETEIESETEKYVQPTIINNTIAADLDDLSNIYYEVKRLADDASKAMVLVTSIKSNKDWFENEIEVPDNINGLIVANNGVDLLVLVNYDQIQGANTIQVTFTNDIKAEATLQAFDSELNLAIIAIDLNKLPEEVQEIEGAYLGESSYLPVGTPIIAIGSPNGRIGSMEIGMVSSRNTNAYITDYQVDLYHTDINYVDDGQGYIINLKGKIVGIITTYLSDNINKEISTFIGISEIKPIIESLVNNEDRACLGIKAIDITSDALEELELTNGIAVTSVVANSPAFYNGIQVGDIITSINDEDITSVKNYQSMLLESKPEDVILIEIHREYHDDNDIIEVEAMLGTRQY